MGLLAFIISIASSIMLFFEATRLPAFIVAIVGIIYAIVTGYQKTNNKDKKPEEKESKTKQSEALEVGATIISGFVCVIYLALLWFK